MSLVRSLCLRSAWGIRDAKASAKERMVSKSKEALLQRYTCFKLGSDWFYRRIMHHKCSHGSARNGNVNIHARLRYILGDSDDNRCVSKEHGEP